MLGWVRSRLERLGHLRKVYVGLGHVRPGM